MVCISGRAIVICQVSHTCTTHPRQKIYTLIVVKEVCATRREELMLKKSGTSCMDNFEYKLYYIMLCASFEKYFIEHIVICAAC
jgi:hypothetical protein